MPEPPPGFVRQTGTRRERPEPPPGFVYESDLRSQEPAQQGRPRWLTAAQNVPLTIAQGVMGGGFDEFAAKFGEVTGYPSMPPGQGDYESRLATARGRLEEIPLSARVAGEGLGAAATLHLGGAAIPARAARAINRVPGWLRASGLGAGIGGAFGFGGGEGGLEPRLEAAKPAAGGGAIGGLGGSVGARAAGAVGRNIRDWYTSRYTPRKAAMKTTERAFAADEIAPEAAAKHLEELGPEGTLLDVGGPTVSGVTRGVTVAPGTGRTGIIRTLDERSRAEGERVSRALGKGISKKDFYAAEDAFLKDQRTRASPLYEQAYAENQSVITPGLREIVKSPRGKRALRQAATLIEDDITAGRAQTGDREALTAIKALIEGKGETGIPLRAWHHTKRGFDALISQPRYTSGVTGRLTPEGRGVDGIRRRLRRELIDATGGDEGAYGQANAIWSGDADAIQALRLGRKATRRDPERIARDLADLQSEASREAYRTGFARALSDMIDAKGETGNVVRRIWWPRVMQKRIRAIAPDDESYNELARALSAEMLFGEKAAPILQGSRTAPMAAEAVSAEPLGLLGTGAAMIGAATVGSSGRLIIAGRAAGLSRKIVNILLGPESPRYYKELSKILVSKDQKENQWVLAHLRSLPRNEGMSRLTKALVSIGAVGGEKFSPF